ncbi:hypothetical protein [Paenibacillus whitsoniae]|uniref:Uncharacterized protein n=1 Tax=Paenibacillus whitsoniae TaxID=2496558 RepID=A0A430J5P9_9BACL|nr:hypothetical protein [Paenibacillus whitsoniae]RTE03522.1 hypothetical protein EJQ19_28030 [Paenibacillus whitsoniae]
MSRNEEDKEIMAWLEKLAPEELNRLQGVDLPESDPIDETVLQRIKKRTLARVELEAQGAQKVRKRAARKRLRLKWAAALCLAVIVGGMLIVSSPEARAQLKKALQYIPGFGYVKQIDDVEQSAYVMDKPFKLHSEEHGNMTVDGILLQMTGGQVLLSGEQASAVIVKTLILVIDQVNYEFKQSHASWAGGGVWQAEYYYEGSIPYKGQDKVWIKFGQTSSELLPLTKAMTASDLAGFGSSDSQSGIQITAVVTPLDGNSSKINLLTQLPEGQNVDSYGKQPIEAGLELQLTDGQGRPITVKPDSGFVKSSELLFENTNGTKDHQLIIPAISIKDAGAKHVKVILPVPEEGAQDIHVTSQIAGFPVDFTRIERVDAKSVRVDVDTHYNSAEQKSLQSYRLFEKKNFGFGMSYSWKINETTLAIETMSLNVEPGQKEVTFYLGEPYIVVRGPWVLSGL